MTRAWTPLLTGDRAARAVSAVTDIAAYLRPLATTLDDPFLAHGLAGLAVFFDYAHAALPHHGYDDDARTCLARAVELAGPRAPGLSLHSGLLGVGWTLAHLNAGDEESFTDLDAVLLEELRRPRGPRRMGFDLTDGVVGAGVYAFERLPAPAARAALEQIVRLLAEWARPEGEGIAWWLRAEDLPASLRAEYPDGLRHLGLAHGVAGVIGFLAAAVRAGMPEPASTLLRGSVAWLLAQRLPPGQGAAFPSQLVTSERARLQGTQFWCRGTPGIVIALAAAARALDVAEWAAIAGELAVGLASTARQTMASPCLCHGAMGFGHMLLRMPDSPTVRGAARDWIDGALASRQAAQGQGFGGFVFPDPDEANSNKGLLSGVAGIGLGLLAAIHGEPGWDRALLLSQRA